MADIASPSSSWRDERTASFAARVAGGDVQREQVQLKPQVFSKRLFRLSDGSWSGISWDVLAWI